jgi:hypothetical protein
MENKTAANIRFGKKLADVTPHQLLLGYCASVPAQRFEFGNRINNELLIIY